GRPARRFRFRTEAGHLLGLEIGPHRVSALLSGLDGRIIGAQAKEVRETATADERLERLRTAVTELLRRAGVARDSLRAVGVGTPGIVEADGTVRLGTGLPGWTGLGLGERVGRSSPCPVLAEDDAGPAGARRLGGCGWALPFPGGRGWGRGGGWAGPSPGRCWGGTAPTRPWSPSTGRARRPTPTTAPACWPG